MTYIPPPYRPRLLPRVVYWGLVAVACVVVVLVAVRLCWAFDGFYHGVLR